MSNRYGNNNENKRYAVILAGGDGSRLKPLTRAISGDDRPKQFCPILNGKTLLEVTRERVALKISPDRIYYSLTAAHERFYRTILGDTPKRRMIVQPSNRGTAPAILLSLLQVVRANPNATVAFFPSDHYFSDDATLMQKVETAFQASGVNPASIVLLGIEPDSPETSYGWIEPNESFFGGLANGVSRVRRFWEKPNHQTASELMVGGSLWNSFVMIGNAATMLRMIEKQLPDLYRIFAAASKSFGSAGENAVLRSVYGWIDETNFSSEVLEKSADELFVMRVADVAWSDLGEPRRVLGTLGNLGQRPEWMSAVAA